MPHVLVLAALAFPIGIGLTFGLAQAVGNHVLVGGSLGGALSAAILYLVTARWGLLRPAWQFSLVLVCLTCLGGWATATHLQWWSSWADRLAQWDTLEVRGSIVPTSGSQWWLAPAQICAVGTGRVPCFNGRLPAMRLVFGSGSLETAVTAAGAGSCILAVGRLKLPRRAGNRGEFDPWLYALRSGLVGDLSLSAVSLCGSARRPSFARTREAWRRIITEAVTGEAGILASAIILGGKASTETEEILQRAGLSHIMSVSGLHVGLVVATAWLLLRGEVGRRGFLGLLAALLFVLLTGGRASSLRAFLAASVAFLARQRGVVADPWLAAAAAWLYLLVMNPMLLFDAGLLLSFSGVAGILVVGRSVMAVTIRGQRTGMFVRWLQKPLALSIGAQAGTAFFTANYFNSLSVIGPLANVVGVPLATVILVTGLIGCFWEWVSLSAVFGAGGFLFLAVAPSRFLFRITEIAARGLLCFGSYIAMALPWAAVEVPSLPWLLGLGWAFLICGLADFLQALALPVPLRLLSVTQARRWLMAAMLVSLLYLMPGLLQPERLIMTFFDVGQGDAILLQAGSKAVLIDAGGRGKSWDASALLLRQLRRRGVRDLVAVVSTHYHSDHLGGMAGVIAARRVHWAWDNGQKAETATYADYQRQLAGRGVSMRPARAGDILRLGQVELEVLWPPRDESMWNTAAADANAGSIVLKVTCGDIAVLLMADATRAVQEELLREQPVAAVLWKAPHQGAAGSFHSGFFQAVSPRVSVISVGSNAYGHPSPQVVERLQEKGTLCRTDLHGAVQFATDGRSWRVRGTKGVGCRARGKHIALK